MTLGARPAVAAAIALLVVVGVGFGAYVAFIPEKPAVILPPPLPVPVVVPVVEDNPKVIVKKVRGKVEAQQQGKWQRAEVGAALDEKDAIRTGPGAEASLAVGEDDSRVLVKERSEVSVREVTSEWARVRLERGRLGADLKGKVVLKVESSGSDAVAESKKGRFSVFNNGKGLVAVSAETARVELKTAKGVERIEAGKQVTVTPDKQLVRNTIPQAVFLNVNWPTTDTTRAKQVAVRGEATAHSEVRVNGRLVVVKPDGSFVVDVPLREGKNAIDVQAVDVMGRKKRTRKRFTAYHNAPKVDADGKAMWK